MEAKVVLHFLGGRLVKGITRDFLPTKTSLTVIENDTGESVEAEFGQLKAIFFVKSYGGNPQGSPRQDVERAGLGRKIRVDFKDSETLIGYTSGYSPGRTGFFVFPADPKDNNEKVFVIVDATEQVSFL